MSTPRPPGRLWANISLLAGGLWLALSVAPLFITTLLGLPFAVVAVIAGWLGWRTGDPAARRRAGWGWGLSCAGCLWQVIYFALVGGALVMGLPSLIQYFQKTPLP